jgi:hypothetical protein
MAEPNIPRFKIERSQDADLGGSAPAGQKETSSHWLLTAATPRLSIKRKRLTNLRIMSILVYVGGFNDGHTNADAARALSSRFPLLKVLVYLFPKIT